MSFNLLAILTAALVTLPIGFVYYHPAVFGGPWMRLIGKTQSELMQGSMAVRLLVSVLLAFFTAFSLQFHVIHQLHLMSLLSGAPDLAVQGSAANLELQDLLSRYGDKYRTFGHGALHGVLTGVFFVFPVIAVNNLYEKRSVKLSLMQSGYWILALAVMGGILCAWR
jgi:hypothetical protein